jgi:hypothetical protein
VHEHLGTIKVRFEEAIKQVVSDVSKHSRKDEDQSKKKYDRKRHFKNPKRK